MKQVIKMTTKYGKTLKILKRNPKLPVMQMRRFAMPVEMLGNAMSFKETDDLVQYHFSDGDTGCSFWLVPLRDGATIECGFGTAVIDLISAKQNKEFPDAVAIVKAFGTSAIASVVSRDYIPMANNDRFGKASFLVFHQNNACYETTFEGYKTLRDTSVADPGAFFEIIEASRSKAAVEAR